MQRPYSLLPLFWRGIIIDIILIFLPLVENLSLVEFHTSDRILFRTYAETGSINQISWFEQQYHGNKPGFLVDLRKSCY